MAMNPVHLVFAVLFFLLLVRVSEGRHVEYGEFKVDYFDLPPGFDVSNISFQNCGPPDPTALVWCRQVGPSSPFLLLRCRFRFTPRVTIFSAYATSLWYLDGKLVIVDDVPSARCQDWGTKPCPWFAKETYETEKVFQIDRKIEVAPKGHYKHKLIVVNQDNVEFGCLIWEVDYSTTR